MKKIVIALALICVSTTAQAQISLRDVVVQRGYFIDKSEQCKGELKNELWDFCGCEADLTYPQIEDGVGHPLIESRINTRLKFLASKEQCLGEPAPEPENADSHSTLYESSYDVLVNDSRYFSVLQSTFHHPAGAAHGMTTQNAVTFAMPDGKPLSMAMMLDESQQDAINAHIYDSIVSSYEGGVEKGSYWDEVLNAKKNSFVNRNACDGCIAYLDKKGVTLAFRPYSVAPHSAGIVTVVIPNAFIGDPALKSYLETVSDAE